MSLTLKEFSERFATLPPGKPTWRKVFPTNLRENETILSYGGLFTSPKVEYELQEQWERVHAGEVIDTEWRPIPVTGAWMYPWDR